MWAAALLLTAVHMSPNEVVFPYSNGGLDPWSAGGVTQNITDSLVAVVIPDGAHHLDLRSRNPLDPKSVQRARAMEICLMKEWIEKARHSHWSVTATTVAISPLLALLGVGPGLVIWSLEHFPPHLHRSGHRGSCPWERQAADGWRACWDDKLQSKCMDWAACSGLLCSSALLKCCALLRSNGFLF